MTLTVAHKPGTWRDEFRWRKFCRLWHTIGLVRNKEDWARLSAF